MGAPMVDSSVEFAVLQEMALPAELDLGRTALLAVSHVVVVATARCPMLGLGRGSTSKAPRTSMWVMAAISTWCGQEEISPASSAFLVFCCCFHCFTGSCLGRQHLCLTTALYSVQSARMMRCGPRRRKTIAARRRAGVARPQLCP